VIISERSDSFNYIPALFRSFLRLSRQKQRARSRHISGEIRETVKHIKSVKVDGSGGHGVMPKSKSFPKLLDKSRAFAAISSLGLESDPSYDRGRVSKFLFFVIPIRHFVASWF